MWKMSPTRWLNPEAIAYVIDYPVTGRLTVYFPSPEHCEDYQGADRMRLLCLLDTARTDLEVLI
jgi:hypothetical protein